MKVEVLTFISLHHLVHGWCPTIQEICDAFGWASKSTGHRYVEQLIEEGFMERDEKGSRQVRLLVEIVALSR